MITPEQIRDAYAYLVRAFRRYWKLSAGVTLAVGFVALVGTFFLPKSYYSEARLFVRFGRENNIDPTATGGQMVSIYEPRESEINSLIEIFKSRAIVDRVVEELGPSYILYGREKPAAESTAVAAAPPPAQRSHGERGDARLAEPPSAAHQQAVMKLEQDVSVWSPRKTNTISVACKAKSPAIAQRIVAKLVEVYLSEHVRVHHTPGSYEFFLQQADLSRKEWQAVAAKLRETKNRLSIVTIDGKRKELQDQTTDIAGKLLTNLAELKTSEAKIASLQKLMAELPATIVTQTLEGPNAAFDGMRQTLYNLEGKQQELASKMQENHPQLVAVRQQVTDLKAILADQPIERLASTEAVNPARQTLEQSLLAEQATADSLRGRGRELLALQAKLNGNLKQLNGTEVEVNQLQQGVELAEARHKEYAQKLEQARINRSLDEERISSLSIIQPASYVAKSTGPRRMYVLALGLFVAITSGLGVALVVNYLNPTLASAGELVELLELPLVGTLSQTLTTGQAV